MKIKNNLIFENNKPYIIAEFSGNHNGDINNFFKLINVAKKAGADAIKLQTFHENTMTINSKKNKFIIKSGLWRGYSYWDLYKKAKTPYKFGEVRQRGTNSAVIIPSHSSENRHYLPVGYLPPNCIVSNAAFVIDDAPLWSMAIVASKLHLVWVATVCGRIKTNNSSN